MQGSVGPSPGAIESDAGDTVFGIADKKARAAHEQVIYTLAEAGVELICIETMFSAKEAAIASDIARKTGLPVAINLTCKYTKDRKTGEMVYRTDWGHSAEDLLDFLGSGEFSGGDNLLEHVQIIGMNCGAETRRLEHTGMPYAINGMRQFTDAMSARGISGIRLMAYPNAGLPQLETKTGRTTYSQTEEDMAHCVPELIDAGAFIVGGCCGTGPSHIRAFHGMLNGGAANDGNAWRKCGWRPRTDRSAGLTERERVTGGRVPGPLLEGYPRAGAGFRREAAGCAADAPGVSGGDRPAGDAGGTGRNGRVPGALGMERSAETTRRPAGGFAGGAEQA